MVRTVAPWNEIMPPLAARERGKCGAPGDSGCAENRCDLDAGKAMNDQAKRMTPLARMLATLNDPHPQPLPTRGRGVHRTCRSHRLYLIGTRSSRRRPSNRRFYCYYYDGVADYAKMAAAKGSVIAKSVMHQISS